MQSKPPSQTATVPETMRYVAMAGSGGPEVLELRQKPTPRPTAGEVLLRVHAAGVNRPDISQRQGSYPPPPGADPELGLEVSGEVVVLGEGTEGFAPGERVVALVNGGGYAEYVRAPVAQCLPWPDGYDAAHAAALPETYFTVWANLFGLGRLASGETALVHGGSSGIGLTAIRLGHEFGARIIATAGNAEKCAACLAAGATAAIDYKQDDFVAAAQAANDGQGVDVVLDMVGGAYFARNLDVLASEGRLVIIAVQGGAKAERADLAKIMLRRLTVCGSTLRARPPAQKAAIAAALRERVWPVLAAGRCKPSLQATFPLAQVAQAHALMEGGSHIGKIVLTVAS